jgi:hypothetical protein
MAGLSSVAVVLSTEETSTAPPTQCASKAGGIVQAVQNSETSAISKNKNDEFWTCNICHIYRLQGRNVESHRLGKKHQAAEADKLKETKNELNGAAKESTKVPNPMQEKLDFHQNTVLERAKTDERFASLELTNGSWSCVVCGLHNMQRGDLEPHCCGKKHTVASATHHQLSQQEFALLVEGSWSCTLCDVHRLSVHDVQRHFAGKKHANGVQQRLRKT